VIIQGLKLTLLGMIVVFSFLILLLAVIHLSAKLFKPYTLKEAAAITSPGPPAAGTPPRPEDNLRLAAIISAAIFAHRKRTGRKRQP
jgi:sodium pump decarboxylase gamma subunit